MSNAGVPIVDPVLHLFGQVSKTGRPISIPNLDEFRPVVLMIVTPRAALQPPCSRWRRRGTDAVAGLDAEAVVGKADKALEALPHATRRLEDFVGRDNLGRL